MNSIPLKSPYLDSSTSTCTHLKNRSPSTTKVTSRKLHRGLKILTILLKLAGLADPGLKLSALNTSGFRPLVSILYIFCFI